MKDMFHRDIRIGDNIVHLWCELNNDGSARGGKKAVKHKHARVIGFTEKTVRIEWFNEHGDMSSSSIKNTRNRIIILSVDKNLMPIDKYKIILDKKDKNLRDLKEELDVESRKLSHSKFLNSELINKVEEMQETIEELSSGFKRFEMLDL